MTIAPALILAALIFRPEFSPAQVSPHGPLGQQCSNCHSAVSWAQLNSPLGFDHDTTAFPLRGQHRTATCAGCHTTLRFADTPADCISCHRKDFDAAVSVGHRSAGFSTDCTECHSADASSWLASFDHDRTNFPTRGAHQVLPCSACHAGNRFRGTPVECVGCHQQQYASAQKPNHIAAGFSTDCAMCHRALTWQPAAFFPHGWFPIDASARHSPGTWNGCTDCHPAQPNYSTFECIFCHHHDKASTDQAHSGRVDNYLYKSSACYRCHPAGEAGGGGG